MAIANVAEVAQAGVGEDVAVELPQGQRVVAARDARQLGGRVRARRARALPEHGRDGRGDRARRRRAGRRGVLAAGRRRADRPDDPRRLPAVRRGARVPHGRRAGDRGARLRNRDGGARRRRRGPGKPVRAGGQATAVAATSGSTGSPARATCSSLLGADAGEHELRAGGAGHARAGRARRGQPRGRGLASRERRRATRGDARAARRRAPHRRRRGVRARAGRRCARGRRARKRIRTRAPAADRRRGGGARADRHAPPAACSWAPRAPPRSATTSQARTMCCRPAAPRASPRCSRRVTSGAGWPRCASVRRRQAGGRGVADRPRRGIRGARRVDGGAGAGESRP